MVSKKINKKIPKLVFNKDELFKFLHKKIDKDTIVIADEHNFKLLKNLKLLDDKKTLICIDRPFKKEIEEKKKITAGKKVIVAIGGCSALDFGRACAHENAQIFLIPSILSTACISVNKSILYDEKYNHEVVVTPVPDKVIINWRLILSTETYELEKWSQSGFGDIIAKISALMDYLFKNQKLSSNISVISLLNSFFLNNKILNILKILDWIINNFEKYVIFDQTTLEKLAIWSYRVGVEVILRKTLSEEGGEHDLYYEMLKQQKYSKELPTHGQIVTIGTLLNAKIVEKIYGEKILFQKLKKAFKKLKLPTTYEELEKINITKSHILEGIKAIKKKCMITSFFEEKLLDECYES